MMAGPTSPELTVARIRARRRLRDEPTREPGRDQPEDANEGWQNDEPEPLEVGHGRRCFLPGWVNQSQIVNGVISAIPTKGTTSQ
jgi:hypothetical protein